MRGTQPERRPAAAAILGTMRSASSVSGGRRAVARGPVAPMPTRSLLWRVFTANALVLSAAALALALTPATVSWPVDAGEAVLLTGGLAFMLLADLLLMRRALAPLGRLWDAMRRVDPLHPGQRVDPGARSVEVAELAAAFNDMLDRLERERRDSARRTQAAQEDERRWLSLELHDEIGQSMTALLLQLDVLSRTATPAQAPLVQAATEATRDCLQRVRAIVHRIRPEALDDLGLPSALVQLCERMSASGALQVGWELDRDLPVLTDDAQLVVYRVAQESLTNIVRHANARLATVALRRHAGGVRLTVTDDGTDGAAATAEGSGIRGMRERALTIGATLRIGHDAGTTVALEVPAAEAMS